MSNIKRLVIVLLILVIAIPAGAFGYIYFKLNKMYDSSSNTDILNNNDYKSEKGITNILLVGTDGRSSNENATRSDSMMILTVDNKHKSLKLTSLARDSYVNIPGHGYEKLTHSYAYGGIDLLVQTIENNFELDIQNYAIVDFFSFMDIINSIGGIEIDVLPGEISQLRTYTYECYNLYDNPKKGSLEYITQPGTQKLNGFQALAYTRIRYNDSAFKRDERQRKVMQSLVQKVSNLPITKFPALLDSILPYVKTNMKPSSILNLGSTILNIGNFNIKQLEFPILEYSNGGKIDKKGWVLQFDSDKSLPILHDFIFKDVMYEGSNS